MLSTLHVFSKNSIEKHVFILLKQGVYSNIGGPCFGVTDFPTETDVLYHVHLYVYFIQQFLSVD